MYYELLFKKCFHKCYTSKTGGILGAKKSKRALSLHGSFLVNDFKRHAVFCVVCFALVEKPWIICFLQLLLRRMLGLSIAAMYVLKLNYYNKKKSFFRPYANYFHGLSLLCMFAFTFRIREQEQILLNTI